jgi:stage V sporulation protein G
MKVTEIQIIPIKPNNGLVAFASVVVDDSLYLGSIGIHTRIDSSGYRLTYPTKPIGGRDLNIYHPINKEASEAIEQAIVNRYKEVMKETNDRYNSSNNEAKRI